VTARAVARAALFAVPGDADASASASASAPPAAAVAAAAAPQPFVPPYERHRRSKSKGVPWGGDPPGPSPPALICAKCCKDKKVCIGHLKGERQFGLDKGTLMRAGIAVAESAARFNALSGTMAPGNRYVFTRDAESLAVKRFGGDREKMDASSKLAVAAQLQSSKSKSDDKRLRARLGGLNWMQYYVLINPRKCGEGRGERRRRNDMPRGDAAPFTAHPPLRSQLHLLRADVQLPLDLAAHVQASSGRAARQLRPRPRRDS
jgi:hypothetical protein